MVVGGFSMALTMTPAAPTAMGSVPAGTAGVGSAVLNSTRQVGGATGIAVMGAIVAAYVEAPRGSPGAGGELVHGVHHAFVVSAGIAFTGAVLAITTIRHHVREPVLAADAA